MAGRFDESRMAKWMPSRLQPSRVMEFMVFSRASSVTVEASTTLYSSTSPCLRVPYFTPLCQMTLPMKNGPISEM